MKKYHLFLIFFLILSDNIFSSEDSYVFAPFVSRFKAVEENSAIKLTWKDSRDVEGSYLIYRHTEQINRQNFTDAFFIYEVEEDIEEYTDSSVINTDFYYAIIAKSMEGDIFDLFIPYRNTTIQPVSIKSKPKIEDIAAEVKYLRVSVKNDSLLLTFESSSEDRKLAVLRNISPIFNSGDLISSTLINIIPGSRSSYTDFPIPGVPYYYSVLDAEEVKISGAELIPFENTTLTPEEVPLSDITERVVKGSARARIIPLPGFVLGQYIESGEKMQTIHPLFKSISRELDEKTEKTVTNLLTRYKKEKPALLDKQLLNPADFYNRMEDVRLSIIIENYFFTENWSEFEKNLLDYIRSAEKISLKNRGRYYLGQALYFQNKYQQAVMEFLLAAENYYPESNKWIKHIIQSL